jgi:PAS domain S-box-containing protein
MTLLDTSRPGGAIRFLDGGGEMGALMRAHDWSNSPLGPPDAWPQSLRSVVGLLLNSRFPMFVAWGEELGFLYNDAYSEILGAKHPGALGARFQHIWAEIWPDISPLIDAALAGQATYRENLPLLMNRKGFDEQTWFTFSYSPVHDEQGKVAGMFCACHETTDAVLAERQLSETSRRLDAILNNTREAVFLMDHRQYCVYANAAAEKLTGYRFEEMQGRPLHDVVHHKKPDGSPYPLEECPIDRAFPERAQMSGEELFVHKNGHFYPVAFTASPVLDDDGEPVGTVIEARDISTEKAQGEALREGAQTLETLNRTGAALAAELDLDRVVQMVTDAGVELTGAQFGAFFYNVLNEAGEAYMLYTLSGAERSDFESFGMPRATAVFKPTFDGEGVVRSDDIMADPRYGRSAPHHGMPKGHLPVRSYLAVPVTSRTGEVLGGLFFGHSTPGRFTERHEQLMAGVAAQAAIAIDNARLYQAAQRARETLERRVVEAIAERKLLADIVETTDAFVQIADLDFNWLGINRAAADEFERIYGVRPKVGDNMLDLLAHMPEHQAAVRQVWGRALAGEEFTEIAEFGDPGRTRRFYEMKYNTLRDAEGRRIGAYQFVYDVTERLRDQRRLSEAEDALRQSQKMEAVGQLVSGLAHDFNNLLGAVVGSLDIIRRRADDPDRVRRFAEAGLQAAERGSKLTGQLLAFSRSQRIELKPLVVCDVINGLRDMLARTLGPMIELEFDLNPCPVPVLADATQVEMTILNLAINARDAMPDGGRLRIATALRQIESDPELKPGEYVELIVADTGFGMDANTLQRAMDPFFTTKPIGKGTGLGLAQVYGSARQSGGTVRIESRLGAGTTVRVLLPRTDSMGDDVLVSGQDTISGEVARATVLIIDDDSDLRGVLVNSLEALGYGVMEAADGATGLTMLDQERPDVLVVDFAMPGMNGAEVAKAARERCPGLPVVLTSGYADSEAIDRAVGQGAKVLRKPFRIDELLSAVSKAIKV